LLDVHLADRIKQVEGVDAVEGTLVDIVEMGPSRITYVFGVPLNSGLLSQGKLIEGRELVASDRRKIAIGSRLARTLDKKLHDTVEYSGYDFEIAAIFDSFNPLESNGAVIPLAEMQEILDKPNRVTTFLVMLKKEYKTPEKVEKTRQQIEALEETDKEGKKRRMDIDVKATQDHVKTNFETQIIKGLAWISSTVAMLIGFISMLNTMMMSITERIREIATFRAIGWRKSRVMRMIIMEALLLSTGGAVVGFLMAWPLMEFLTRFSMTNSLVVSHLTAEIIGKGIGMGVLAGLLGAVYPAWIAAQLAPASALRYE
jgi:putative ABC transport system permease protein